MNSQAATARAVQPPLRQQQMLRLHSAMRTILLNQPGRTATIQAISDENARRDLYRRNDRLDPPLSEFNAALFCIRPDSYTPPQYNALYRLATVQRNVSTIVQTWRLQH